MILYKKSIHYNMQSGESESLSRRARACVSSSPSAARARRDNQRASLRHLQTAKIEFTPHSEMTKLPVRAVCLTCPYAHARQGRGGVSTRACVYSTVLHLDQTRAARARSAPPRSSTTCGRASRGSRSSARSARLIHLTPWSFFQ